MLEQISPLISEIEHSVELWELISFNANLHSWPRQIRRMSFYQSFSDWYEEGLITDWEIEKYFKDRMRDTKPGFQMPHEYTVVALCVLMNDADTEFGKRFVKVCARLDRAETAYLHHISNYLLEEQVES